MNCVDSRKLVNREVDGRTSPEEEAMLMQHIGSCAACAHEQRIQHRIHQALKALRSPEAAPGLSSRIADAVLAGGPDAAKVIPFRARLSNARVFKAAAVVLFTVGLAGLAGWFLGQDTRPVQANPTSARAVFLLESEGWLALGLPAESARKIALIKSDFEDLRKRAADQGRILELHGQETMAILQEVQKHPDVFERYRQLNELSSEDLENLRTRGHR